MFLKKNRPDQKRSGRFFLIFLIQVSGGNFQFFTGLTAPEKCSAEIALCHFPLFPADKSVHIIYKENNKIHNNRNIGGIFQCGKRP